MGLVKATFATVVILALLLLAAPIAGKWYLKDWLEQKGFDVAIKHLSINYFLGRVSVYSATLAIEDVEQASVFQFDLDFDLLELIKGRFVVDSLTLDNLDLNVSKKKQRWAFAGLTLSQWLDNAEADHNMTFRRVDATNADLCTSDRQQCLRLERLTVGALNLARSGRDLTLTHSSPLFLTKMFLQDRNNTASVFYLGALDLQQSSFSKDRVFIKGFNLNNLQLVESQPTGNGQFRTPYQTQIGELSITELEVGYGESPSIRLHNVDLVSLRQTVERQVDRETIWSKRIETWFPDFYDLWQGVRLDGTGTIGVHFSEIDVQGGRFNWRDDSVRPPAIARGSDIKLVVDSIDSNDRAKTKITFSSKLGETGAIKFETLAQFFEGEPLFNTTGTVQGLELDDLSGYTDLVFGQHLTEGMIDVSFDVGAAGGQVAGNSRWRLTGLNSESAAANMSRSFKALADHNQQVEFELPVGLALRPLEGSFASLGHAVKAALNSAAKGSPMPKLRKPQPSKVVSFEPIFFEARQVSPAALDLNRMPSIAKALQSQPDASIEVCPMATRGEWAAIFNRGVDPDGDVEPQDSERYKLLDLTERRGNTLKRLLIAQGVNPNRIEVCEPNIEIAQSGPSRATFSLQ